MKWCCQQGGSFENGWNFVVFRQIFNNVRVVQGGRERAHLPFSTVKWILFQKFVRWWLCFATRVEPNVSGGKYISTKMAVAPSLHRPLPFDNRPWTIIQRKWAVNSYWFCSTECSTIISAVLCTVGHSTAGIIVFTGTNVCVLQKLKVVMVVILSLQRYITIDCYHLCIGPILMQLHRFWNVLWRFFSCWSSDQRWHGGEPVNNNALYWIL